MTTPPFPHVREVLELRATQGRCGFLLGGTSCTVEAAQLVESGWALPLLADRERLRRAAPLIRTVGDGELARDGAARSARLPSLAWGAVRDGLRSGPVLVQVPRRGYAPRLACERCRAPARCLRLRPLQAPDQRDLDCAWCGRPEGAWQCAECGSFRLRAQIVGARRTAEELGRAFPAVPVRTSGRDHVLDAVPGDPALVVSTPGAEPVAEGGYAAALLLDGWAMLGRPDLRAGEEALRRWTAAAALVRGQDEGGTVVIVAEPTERAVQALVRWDPAGFARRELAERAELGFPPVSRMASVTGPADASAAFLAGAGLPPEAEILGPVPVPSAEPGRPRRPGDAPAGGELGARPRPGRSGPGGGARPRPQDGARGPDGQGGGRPGPHQDRPARHRLKGHGLPGPRGEFRAGEPPLSGTWSWVGEGLPHRATGTAGQGSGWSGQPLRGPGKAPGRSSSRAAFWADDGCGGIERAAGTEGIGGAGPSGGRPGQPGGDGDRAGHGGRLGARLGGGLRGGAARPVTTVHRLLRDAEGGAHRVPGEAQRTVEVHRRGDQGLDAVPQFLREADGGGRGPAVDDEPRGGAGAARAVDVAQLGGEGAQCVHLPPDPLDVPHQKMQTGPRLGVVRCVVGHEEASRTGVERDRAAFGAARFGQSPLTNARAGSVVTLSGRTRMCAGRKRRAYAPGMAARPQGCPGPVRPQTLDWCAARHRTSWPERQSATHEARLHAYTPEVAVPALDALIASDRHEVAAVVTRPDAPA